MHKRDIHAISMISDNQRTLKYCIPARGKHDKCRKIWEGNVTQAAAYSARQHTNRMAVCLLRLQTFPWCEWACAFTWRPARWWSLRTSQFAAHFLGLFPFLARKLVGYSWKRLPCMWLSVVISTAHIEMPGDDGDIPFVHKRNPGMMKLMQRQTNGPTLWKRWNFDKPPET